MKRAFGSLSPQEGLHVAIFIEERNAEIYRNFSEMFAQFGDPDSLEISLAFLEMSLEERHHSSRLQQRYAERYGTRPCSVTEDDVSDLIEVPNLHSADVFNVHESDPTSPRDKAFAVAIVTEKAAADFYRRLADGTHDPGLRAFYQEFVQVESQHSSWLEQRVANAQRHDGGSEIEHPVSLARAPGQS
jgi:rubrerythrin